MDCLTDLREFGHWKSRRDALIRRALRLGIPVERISVEMQVSKSVIQRVRNNTPRR